MEPSTTSTESYLDIIVRLYSDPDLSPGFLMLKPGFDQELVDMTLRKIHDSNLSVERWDDVMIPRLGAIAMLSGSVLLNAAEDYNFGNSWKKDTIEYLSSAKSRVFAISGHDTASRCLDIRKDIRRLTGKVASSPDRVMSDDQFYLQVVQNTIHSPDPHEIAPFAWIIDELVDSPVAMDSRSMSRARSF